MKKNKKPFNGPYCTICHYIKQLCNKCEKYVNQDHVGQKEKYVLPNSILEEKNLTTITSVISSNSKQWLLSFDEILIKAKLSPKQIEVLNLLLKEGKTLQQAAVKMGVCKHTVVIHQIRALKRLRACLTMFDIVRDYENSPKIKTKRKLEI